MVQKNIDELLKNTSSAIWLTGNIEIDDTVTGISTAQILGEIDTLANTMTNDLPMMKISAQVQPVQYRDAKKAYELLRKLDGKATKYTVYQKVRPILRRRLAHLVSARYADGRQLLALDNTELIVALYQIVLGRKPEPAAINSGMLFLTSAGTHKLDLIDSVVKSDEARMRNVRLRGLTGKRIRLRIKRKFSADHGVDIRNILRFNHAEFICVLYWTVLRRSPEAEAIAAGVKFLNRYGNHKIDLIVSVLNSEEAKQHNVRIKGLRVRKFLLKCKRKLYRIPVLGYLARWFAGIVMLPRRMDYMFIHLSQLQSSQEMLSAGTSAVEEKLHGLNWYVSDQNEKRLVLEKNVEGLTGEYERLSDACADMKVRCENITAQTAALRVMHEAALHSIQQDLNGLSERNSQRMDSLTSEWAAFVDGLNADKQAKEQLALENKAFFDKLYVNYNEKLLPDSRESVKQGLQIYLDKLNLIFPQSERGNVNIVDLGCGECEWVELLRENGYNAIGVDSNSRVVKKVMEGLPAIPIVENGALEYLKSCEDHSVDVLTSFHMVEHLELLELMELLKECHRVLKKDGILAAETPNPQNLLTATYYFYLDPTHKKPLPCELLAFLVQEAGFVRIETVFRNPLNFEPYEYRADDPIKDIVFRFNLEQAYAIWAVK